jgi:hypothetical protein
LLSTFIDTLMSAEADAVCGAEYGTSSPNRVNTRNGYLHRDFDTRAGTLDETNGRAPLPKHHSTGLDRDCRPRNRCTIPPVGV